MGRIYMKDTLKASIYKVYEIWLSVVSGMEV